MIMKQTVVIVLVGLYGVVLSCSGVGAWETSIKSGTVHGVALDRAANVLAAGVTNELCETEEICFGDFTVAKFSGADGTELWRQVIGGGRLYHSASAVVVDSGGYVVAAGYTNGFYCFFLFCSNFTVIKFDASTGKELWRRIITSTTNGGDAAAAVAVDSFGNVVAAGYIWNEGTFSDFTVIKFDGVTGAELWRQVITGTAFRSYDSASAVAVDAAGNVVAVGLTGNEGTANDFTVTKLNGATGAELWRQVINGSASSWDSATELAIDPAGNVMAAGYTVNKGTDSDFTVIKFNGATGAELWRQVINGSASSNDRATGAVAIDAAGNIIAAGSIWNTGTGEDLTVIKLDNTTGTELWRRVINGVANGSDTASAVAIDSAGNVVAAGGTQNNGTSSDFTVVKLDGLTGQGLWHRVTSNTIANSWDWANAVAVDVVGNVVAAGSIGNDFTVIKLSPEGDTAHTR